MKIMSLSKIDNSPPPPKKKKKKKKKKKEKKLQRVKGFRAEPPTLGPKKLGDCKLQYEINETTL